MTRTLARLHVVTDEHVARHADLETRAAAIARIGSVALHARAPGVEGGPLTRLARTLRQPGAQLFVNDRADVALAVEAEGLHVPWHGLPLDDARRLMGERWLGRSTHSPEEARRALDEGADYVFLGPIWPTASHRDRQPLGPGAVTAALPGRVIAIGGVTPERVPQCRDAGAYGVAVISAVWSSTDPGSVVGAMMVHFG